MKRFISSVFILILSLMTVWAEGTATMSLTNISLKPGEEVTLGVELNNPDDDITGVQCDLYLPHGISIKKDADGEFISQATDRINTRKPHTLAWAWQSDGAMRLLNYSTTNQLYKGTGGTIIEVVLVADNDLLPGSYDINLKNIVVSHPKGDVIKPVNYTGKATILPAEYTLTYILDDKEFYKEDLSAGSSIIPKEVPTKEGYSFSGWKDLPSTMPTHNVTVKGSYIANKYKVTFIADGKVISEKEMEYGASIVAPEAPSKEGHTFVGWGDVDKTVPAHDATYTAEYKANSYKLTYEVDGVTYHSEDVAFGTAITPLPAPQNEGKTFSGWSEIPATMPSHDVRVTGSFSYNSYMVKFVVDGKVIYEKSQAYGSRIVVPTVDEKEGYTFSGFGDVDETVPAHDVAYNGSYIANKYKVTFIADGKVISEKEMEYGASIVAPEAPSKEGHTFVGWGDVDKTVPAHDATYTAEYKVNSYKLTYEVDGVTYHSEDVAFGTAITPLPAPQNEGKTFSGWSEIPATMPAHDVRVTGSFSYNSYMVKFVVDGKVIYEKSQAYGSRIVVPTVDEKEGYTFSGFGDVDETVPAHDVAYNGSYIANKYKVTFIADGKVISETEMEYGASIVAPEAPSKEGHTFVGWGDVDKTVPAHDATYTAEYKANSYKLTYEVDGVTYHSEDVAFGTAITPLPAPQNEGKTFSGWSEIPATMPSHDVRVTGSFSYNSYMVKFVVDGKVIYEKSQAYGSRIVVPTVDEKEGYTFSGFGDVDETVPAHDVAYNGSYIANKYKVTFIADGKVISETEMEYGASIVAPEAPSKEGHTFVGWGDVDKTVPAHDATYTAEYKANSYKLTYEVDGVTYHSEDVAFGTAITPLPAPQNEGKTFSGWSEIPATMPSHDVRVTGSFSYNSYMVKFVVDGKVIYEKSQAYGSRIVVPTVDEKEGYTFSGFGDVDETVPAHDVTYNGSYIANKYKVTFVADGKVISETEMEYGASIVAPEAPAKEGHTFIGWGDVDKTVPAHDATYTAEYKVNSYKLTYEVDGVTYHSEDIAFGTAITPLPAPQNEGKTFSGWSEIPATMPAHDVRVTGSFSYNSYMVKFVVDGKVIYEKSQVYGSRIVVPTVDEKEGYTFSGFGDVDETVPAHDVTYNGSYIANKYKVTFIADGKVISETEMEYGAPIVAPEAPEKEGHTFVGWGDVDKTVPAHDATYTAEYKVNIYKLTYILNGNVFAEDSIAYDSIITPRELPDSDKINFSGWEGLPDIMPAHDVVVYGTTTTTGVSAVYNKKQIVTVYSVNGTIVKRNVEKSCLTKILSPGLYIVSGKKILIK